MNKVIINGQVFETSGKNITINNGTIIIDGTVIQEGLTGSINVAIYGDVEKINCGGSVSVEGNVLGDIDCGGSANIRGDVKGSVDCGGSCTCGNVGGDIDAGGSVRCTR